MSILLPQALARDHPLASIDAGETRLMPEYDAAMFARHLPSERPITIEINGLFAGNGRAIPEATREYAIGWALMHGFIGPTSSISHITSSPCKVSLMVEGGIDVGRLRYLAVGWEPLTSIVDESGTSIDTGRAISDRAFISEIEAVSVIERAFRGFDVDDGHVGYVHAAIVDNDEVRCLARDLTPEAAVAKLIGWILGDGEDVTQTLLIVRGIVTERIVSAAARLGIAMIATDAVLTAEAVSAAQRKRQTVIGLALSHRRGILAQGGHFR